ncbi:MAG: site-2 protease family protein [Bacillota bacterium]
MVLMATFASVMETAGYILLALLALMFMIVIHEGGHYLAGKLLGFKILEFSVGFGPAIYKRTSKKSDEIFAIRTIPLGGYCQFEDEDDNSKSPTAFNNQPAWKRLIVLFSGAFFNLISAWIIITFVFTFSGQITLSVASTYSDSANVELLQAGDAILKVDGKQINILEASDATGIFAEDNDTAVVQVLRDGEKVTLTLTKSEYQLGAYDDDGVWVYEYNDDGSIATYYGYGFASTVVTTQLSFFTALGRSFSYMFFLVYKIIAILGMLITGQLGMESAGGPITTITAIADASRGGSAMLAYVVCLVSANLAVMNLLPLPALDGSRMVFCLIEMIFKKPVPKKVEGIIHTVGFLAIFAFAILADIFQLFLL